MLTRRELSVALSYLALFVLVVITAPSFLQPANLRDLAINNASVLVVAVGMTLVIIAGEIDISVGSQFAVCTYAAGLLAKAGIPIVLLIPSVLLIGAAMGAVAGILIAGLRVPSIVATLALMVIWRDALRWGSEGAWIQGLPANFQWFGLGQTAGDLIVIGVALLVFLIFAWSLRNLSAGRFLYAVGSDSEAARLAGIGPQRVKFVTFVLMGALTALAALINVIRFSIVPANAGFGLELKAIAAVVVGGVAITGGRGTVVGSLVGVALLGTIGTALTFLGINPFWEKAIQGAIILAAVVSYAAFTQLSERRAQRLELGIRTQ
jgi:rhamnose transport system permease protein